MSRVGDMTAIANFLATRPEHVMARTVTKSTRRTRSRALRLAQSDPRTSYICSTALPHA